MCLNFSLHIFDTCFYFNCTLSHEMTPASWHDRKVLLSKIQNSFFSVTDDKAYYARVFCSEKTCHQSLYFFIKARADISGVVPFKRFPVG